MQTSAGRLFIIFLIFGISINKVHGVVLKSKENIYYFSVPAHNGKTAMENEINAGYKLASDNILLKANIPTVMFDDGFYRLYLFNYESDEIYGMCDTGLIFEKRGDTFSQYFGQSIDPLGDIPFDSVRLSIDSIEQIGLNQIRVYGWANESFIDTQEQNVYVEFYNDPFEKPIATYHCSGIRRSGLGEYFGEERYDFSGFQLNVEKPKKLNDEFYIRLAIGDSQHIVRSHIRVAYRYDGNRYEMTEWRNTGDDQARGGNTLISDDLEKSDQSYVYSEQIKDFRFNYGEATIEKKENMHYIHTIDSALIDGPICRIARMDGIRVIPSQANYFMIELTNGMTSRELTCRMMREHNMLIKDLSGKIKRGDKQYIRVAVRKAEDNDALCDALNQVLHESR